MKRLLLICVLAFLMAAVCRAADARPVAHDVTIWQQAVEIVMIPWVTVVLLAVGITLLIAELMTIHTWGVTGTTGVVFLAVVFGAYISSGTATWVGVVIFLVGLALFLVETHVVPGHGISALAGTVCVFLGLYWALGGAATNALFTTLVAGFFTMMTIAAFLVYLPRSSAWRMLGQKMEQTPRTSSDYSAYLEQSGVAVTPLRPAGVGEFDGCRLDVLSEGGFIPDGTPIKVVGVQGSRIFVREITEAA